MGYHPGSEDDAIYLSAVKNQIDPSLYPHNADFFKLQLQHSTFDQLMAAFVRWTGVPVALTEMLWHFASILLIVIACWSISRRLFTTPRAQWAGVALVTAMFTLPVAGTALYLVDQHLHPRNLATALILLAVSRCMASRRWQAIPLLGMSFLLHPIAAAMGVSFCFFLTMAKTEFVSAWFENRRSKAKESLVASFVPPSWPFGPAPPAWRQAVDTRPFLTLFRWEWYEWLGALAPLLLFWILWRIAQKRHETVLARFALAVFAYGVFQQTIAMIMLGFPSLIRLAPLQPMRYLHLLYFFLVLIGGCLIGEYLLKTRVWRWGFFLLIIYLGMFIPQRLQFSGSYHLEIPGLSPANPWLQAFEWVRRNTPKDAYFALDPDYMTAPGEDYHSFRALAERSQLADRNKDTAVVTLVPQLGLEWTRQVSAQNGWGRFQLVDFERLKKEFGVNWVMVSLPEPAGLACFWHNDALSVCRIP